MLALPVPRPIPHSPPPADDLRAAQAGDAEAFGRLYRAEVGRVHALALRLTGDAQRAEELVQDAFVRAWRKLPSFRAESSLATWLHRLTVNVFLLNDRGARRRALREIPDEDLAEHAGPRRSAAHDVEDRVDLERAIARLPEGARVAFVLFDVYGYSHEEIAAEIGVATGTIRAQLHRARRRLREELDR